MATPVVIDMHEITVTPVFKYMEIENIPKSETAGFAVMEIHEMVEIRFAGSKNNIPCVPAQSFWRREGNQVFTYAERWADQYRAFKEGNPQEARGTPLEMLRPYGITPEQLSLCRAMRIYSIEALDALTGAQVKSLGMNANSLKAAAADYMAATSTAANSLNEIETLKARIAQLEGRSTQLPAEMPSDDEVSAALRAADSAFSEMSDAEIKDAIVQLGAARPRGNPSRATLVQALDELTRAA